MPVFVRAEGPAPSKWGRSDKLEAGSLVSLSENGPFRPLGLELLQNDPLRSEIAVALDVPSVSALDRVRRFAPVLALPLLWLAWVDYAGDSLSPVALHTSTRMMWPALDVLAAGVAAFDASRRAPHRRWLAFALVFGGVGRLLNQSAENCTLFFSKNAYGSTSAAWVGAVLSLLAIATLVLWTSRTAAPRLVTRQILDALEIDVDTVLALPEPKPPRTELVVVVSGFALAMCGIGTFMKERPLAVQAVLALLVALAAASIVQRMTSAEERSKALRALTIGGLGFLGAAFAARAIQQGFDAGGNILRCRDLPSFEASGAKRQLLLESVEMLSSRARARDTIANLISTIAALPVAYELLFRGAFQRVIARRYSSTSALFIGALGYAVAASMTYESLFYRTIAAGLAFGLVYAEAGVYAAILAHVLYAAHLVL